MQGYIPGNVMLYGATGDGTTDDTVAIQAALTAGGDVYFPETSSYYRVSSVLTLAAAGQRVYGDGYRSRIVQVGTNANSTVFLASSRARVVFENLHVTPGTTTASLSDGWGFTLSGSDYGVVRDCYVTAARRGGVQLLNSDHCKVDGNWITDSVVVGTEAQSDTGYDIMIRGASTYNQITNNHCINGSGVGIGLQTVSASDSCSNNLIEGNTIKDQDAYGIMVYQVNSTDTLENNIIRGNHVENITGSLDTGGVTLFYGAGIYIQTGDYNLVEGNHVRNSNSNRSLGFSGSAVPAAIAFSGSGNIVINGNVVEDCYWGIGSIQASALSGGTLGRGTMITGNSIRGCDSHGMYLSDCVSATITGNRIRGGAAGDGIYLLPVAAGHMDDFTIVGNRIDNFTAGIEFAAGAINRGVVADNIIRGNTGYAIQLSAVYTNCHDNVVIQGSGGDGIRILSTCTDGYCKDNLVQGGDQGIDDTAGGTLRVENNQTPGSTTAHLNGLWRALPDSATPGVKNARWVSTAFTTAITNFTNGREGQLLTLKALASVTITDGASITLAGSANFAMVSGDTLTLIHDQTTWRELSRGDN